MGESVQEIKHRLREDPGVLGPGWKEVDAFEDLDDIDEYESDDEDVYVVLDLGNGVDPKTFQAESGYQLIGMDTPVPFFKFANQIYAGEIEHLIGDEIVLGIRRSEDDPHDPDRPPLYTTNTRIALRPVTLRRAPDPSGPTADTDIKPSSAAGPPKRKSRGSHAAHNFFVPPLGPPLAPPTELELEEIQRQLLEAEARAQARDEAAKTRPPRPPKLPRPPYQFSGRKPHPINDRETLFNLDFGRVAEYSRFTLDPELAKTLLPPEEIKDVYSPALLKRIVVGRPLHGAGSREKRGSKQTGSAEPSSDGGRDRSESRPVMRAGEKGESGSPRAEGDEEGVVQVAAQHMADADVRMVESE